MIRLDGKALATQRKSDLKPQCEEFLKTYGLRPKLAVVLVGDDPASHVYVRNKIKSCKEVGIESIEIRVSGNIGESELIQKVEDLNQDSSVHGILVQLPLPKGINSFRVIQRILPTKDVDGLHIENQGLLFAGQKRVAPCTPWGVIQILKFYDIDLVGSEALVIGRSQIVGKPMAQLLLDEDCTVTLCHSKTKDLKAHIQKSKIVVVAAGRPQFLGLSDFSSHHVVVDVGIHRMDNGKLCGDVNFSEIQDKVRAATPVPGGVGPMTIAMLLENTLNLAQLQTASKKRV